jgi:hypothetical protein
MPCNAWEKAVEAVLRAAFARRYAPAARALASTAVVVKDCPAAAAELAAAAADA